MLCQGGSDHAVRQVSGQVSYVEQHERRVCRPCSVQSLCCELLGFVVRLRAVADRCSTHVVFLSLAGTMLLACAL